MAAFITNPQVIHETIDGETIIIDLASGTYFSLQGTGPEIWNAIAGGTTPAAVTARLLELYQGDAREIGLAVESFLGELEHEGLLTRDDTVSDEDAVTHNGSSGDRENPAFAPPKLEKYTDMQDIILLDPVHEVGERGWPHANPAGV